MAQEARHYLSLGMSTTDCNSGFSEIPDSDSETYSPGAVTQTTYFRRITISTLNDVPCEAISNCVTVTVNDVTAGAIGNDQTICSGATPQAFTSETDGSGSGDISYRWEMSTTDCNSGFSEIPDSDSETYSPGAVTQTTYFRRVTISTLNDVPCEAISNCVIVTINNSAAGVIGSDQTVCITKTPAPFTEVEAASGDGDISYRWEMSTEGCNGSFEVIDGATDAIYALNEPLSETTFFRRVAISTLNDITCEAISNCITVEVKNVDCGTFPWSGNE
ncbi:MAG: hypothetical protein IPJ74_08285 [Saprospiraceae bacterium]|nr:hypothetical protein [Saprospiraceae bacterium]